MPFRENLDNYMDKHMTVWAVSILIMNELMNILYSWCKTNNQTVLTLGTILNQLNLGQHGRVHFMHIIKNKTYRNRAQSTPSLLTTSKTREWFLRNGSAFLKYA